MTTALIVWLLPIAGVLSIITVVIMLSRHKKSGTGPVNLVGLEGAVESRLDPEGTILIAGELWRARANTLIERQTRIRVTGAQAHFLLVESVE